MLKFISKNLFVIQLFVVSIGCLIIIIDWTFIELEYRTKFQWIVSIIFTGIYFFVTYCINHDYVLNQDKDDTKSN